jgi:putative endopeptidase
MNKLINGAIFAIVLIGYRTSAAPLVSGIDTQYFDDTVRAQDDFYQHVTGKWLATVENPSG